MCLCCRYGVAFLYGNKLVREPGSDYDAGRVMTIVFATIIGGFALGQAAPNFPAFATGRAAGYRIFKLIDRKPPIDVTAPGEVPAELLKVSLRCMQLMACVR